ncbi:DNA adenine methylase [Daejeonella sp.]|uniref:DNA adenine methylase n=1 Tax=Daejeonella sp. TaxID=2805397 RepID=UPI0030C5FD80
MNFFSPLRYPGGKASFTKIFLRIFSENQLSIDTYFEFYAGGAGAALELLLNKHVSKIVLNDADYHIYSFWNAIIYDTENFLRKLNDTPVDMTEWRNQKNIYEDVNGLDTLTIGFSTFFLNRTNRSGILLKAGPIGGMDQGGNYKLDARYNKKNLSERITEIAKLESSITIYNEDAINLMNALETNLALDSSFLFLDPPYFVKGSKLYLNHYNEQEHIALRDFLMANREFNWLVSYDNVTAIHDLYRNFDNCLVDINYSLQSKKKEKEIVIFSDKLHFANEPT